MIVSNGEEIIRFSAWLELLRLQLATLARQKCLAFAASCCERLLPNYKAFAAQTRWGNSDGLIQSLALLWELVEKDSKASDTAIQEAIGVCDSAAPDTEQFSSPLTSAALDAANSIAYALEFAQDTNVEHLVIVSSLSRDSIDLYVQARDRLTYSDDGFEDRVSRDPLMIAEIRKQQRDLRVLESMPHLTPEFLASFRQDSLPAGLSNLGISCDVPANKDE